jgi:hypothetical protein
VDVPPGCLITFKVVSQFQSRMQFGLFPFPLFDMERFSCLSSWNVFESTISFSHSLRSDELRFDLLSDVAKLKLINSAASFNDSFCCGKREFLLPVFITALVLVNYPTTRE